MLHGIQRLLGQCLYVPLFVAQFEHHFFAVDVLNASAENLSVGRIVCLTVLFIQQNDVSMTEVGQETVFIGRYFQLQQFNAFIVFNFCNPQSGQDVSVALLGYDTGIPQVGKSA